MSNGDDRVLIYDLEERRYVKKAMDGRTWTRDRTEANTYSSAIRPWPSLCYRLVPARMTEMG